MGIKRYIANIDNTITDVFKADGTRATGSNCGLADTAEVFSVYGVEYPSSSAATASIEKSRALFGFPVDDISTDRTNGHIPSSGSVSFYLRLFNASTQNTTPRSASYSILAVKQSWVEGTGVDLDLHTDDDVSNWVAYKTNTPAQATATFVGNASLDDASGTSIILINADASTVTFTTDPTLNFGDVTADIGDVAATAKIIGNASLDDASGTSFKLVNADGEIITFTTDPTKNFADTVTETASPFTVNTRDISGGSEVRKATQAFWISCKAAIDAGELDMTIDPASFAGTEEEFTLTQTTTGTTGNTAITLITGVTADGETTFTGGIDQRWRVNTKDISGGSEVRKATQAFWIACKGAIDAGELDMTIDPTTFAGTEESFALTQTTAGPAGNTAITLITGMTANGETAFTGGLSRGEESRWEGEGGDFYTGSSDNNILYSVFLQGGTEDIEVDISELVEQWIAGTKNNDGLVLKLSGAYEDGTNERSYFTKQVYTRGSQYFFKRPIIEARFDTSTKDDSARFYISSSLLPAANNLNNLYLYNFFEGQLTNIPAIETSGLLQLSLYSASQQGGVAGDKLFLPVGGDAVTLGDVNVTASYISTGIYSASFAYASSSITSVIPVWTTTGAVVFHTGSAIECKTYSANNWYNNPEYKLSVVNLQDTYYTDERPTFRVFTQDKNRQLNIYTVAFADPPITTITNLFYSIARAVDSKTLIPYGTGTLEYTRLSYDNSGSFFALDMDLFEPGYAYVMSFVRKFGTSFTQLPQKFRFRVQERND